MEHARGVERMERARGMMCMGKRAAHRLVLSAALAGALAALGADVTIFGQAGTAGTIRFNDGAPSARAQISVVDGARARSTSGRSSRCASMWKGASGRFAGDIRLWRPMRSREMSGMSKSCRT